MRAIEILNGSRFCRSLFKKEAAEYCAALGARLPTKIEMMLAYNLGPYASGAEIDSGLCYAVTEGGELKMFLPADGSCLKNRFDQTAQVQVLCLKKP